MSGTWQETWTAVGTVGATVVALLLGGTAEIRHWALRRRAQANQVSAWVEDVPVEIGQSVRMRGFVLNASNEPVWDLVILVDSVARETVGPPFFGVVETIHVGVVPPGHKEPIEYGFQHMPYTSYFPAPLVIGFRDNRGRWWLRDEFGKLNQRDGPPDPDTWIPSWRYTHPDESVRRGLPERFHVPPPPPGPGAWFKYWWRRYRRWQSGKW